MSNAKNHEVQIRPACPDDLAAVFLLEVAAFDDPWSPEAIYGELHCDKMRIPLVAEKDGKLVGYLMAWRVVDQVHILNIATDPECLRQGVGTALLLASTAMAVQGGQEEITLEVRQSNHGARGFYVRHGFAETGLRPGYYQDNGEDAVIMTASCADILAK
ncbi:MAG: ribosomal protein S18-alanine N-acetyltransferase [bacterium]|nr:ribosomal protein S18-alanine N-acetyltransferase [bacterium]